MRVHLSSVPASPRRTVAALPLLLLLAGTAADAQQPLKDAPLERRVAHVRQLLRQSPVMDGHNDLPWAIRESKTMTRDVEAYDLRKTTPGMTDIARLRKGGVGAQFWSVYIPGDIRDSGYAKVQLEQIDIAQQIFRKYPDIFAPTTTAAGVRRAIAAGKIGSIMGMEGGHAIENSLGALRAYYDMGVRYMTLTHNVTLDWADAAVDKATHGGLTPFGREVVREMNRLGMLVDLSHVSPGVMSHALDVTEAPVIFSHSNARAIADVPRNVPDSILARLPKNGGVVMVAFVPGFISPKVVAYNRQLAAVRDSLGRRYGGDAAARQAAIEAWQKANPVPVATISDVADHMDHIKRVAGPAHVGMGADFDGITETVQGLEDVSTYPMLLAELVKRGWTDREIRGVASENVLRVLAQAEAAAKRIRATRGPSLKTIEQLDRKITP